MQNFPKADPQELAASGFINTLNSDYRQTLKADHLCITQLLVRGIDKHLEHMRVQPAVDNETPCEKVGGANENSTDGQTEHWDGGDLDKITLSRD